jgi:hypothetical protein
VPFREWLPYALPFVGGIAFHEFAEVPAYRQLVSSAPLTGPTPAPKISL